MTEKEVAKGKRKKTNDRRLRAAHELLPLFCSNTSTGYDSSLMLACCRGLVAANKRESKHGGIQRKRQLHEEAGENEKRGRKEKKDERDWTRGGRKWSARPARATSPHRASKDGINMYVQLPKWDTNGTRAKWETKQKTHRTEAGSTVSIAPASCLEWLSKK